MTAPTRAAREAVALARLAAVAAWTCRAFTVVAQELDAAHRDAAPTTFDCQGLAAKTREMIATIHRVETLAAAGARELETPTH